MSRKCLFLTKTINVSREMDNIVIHETKSSLMYNLGMFGKKQTKEPTEKQKIGEIGENLACEYLQKNGYKILDRNYSRKWGELDIVSRKGNIIHFVEVKSVSRHLGGDTNNTNNSVTHVTPVVEQSSLRGRQNDSYRAEDNMHPWKLKRLGRAVQSYLLEKDISDDLDWQFDVVTVQIDTERGLHKISLVDDLVL